MAHVLSLACSRSHHMSPAGLALAALLHGAVALALWWISPLRHIDPVLEPIEVTLEQEARPAPSPQPPPPEPPPELPSVQAAPPPPAPPAVQQALPQQMGLQPPVGTTMDPRTPLSVPQADPAISTPGQQAAKREPAKEANPEPPEEIVNIESGKEEPKPDSGRQEQQQAALAPPPPPAAEPQAQPTLEQALPPLEPPPPPLTSREIPLPIPPPPPPPPPKTQPQPDQQARTPPPPAPRPPAPQKPLPSSPLSKVPKPHAPADTQQAARQAPTSRLVNPADAYGLRKTKEDYLWSVVRKIAKHRYYPRSARENNEEGLVVTRVTIARDGRLLGVAISRSSGYHALDNAVLEIIRRAAPYPPLPNDMPGTQHTFVLPLNYKRNDPQ